MKEAVIVTTLLAIYFAAGLYMIGFMDHAMGLIK
jgi:hypothetical protein